MKPIISVVLPSYNSRLFIKETIESILNQSFTNFELIIINDGSTDNSLSVINSFQDKRIVILDQENKGLAFSLNRGIKHSRGKYILRIDSDDLCMIDRFEKQFKFMESHPNIGVLGSAVTYIDDDGKEISRSFPIIWSFLFPFAFKYSNQIAHPSAIIRAEILQKHGLYSEIVGSYIEDYHLWFKLIRHGVKFKNLSEPLIKYRLLDTSISSSFVINKGNETIVNSILNSDNPSPDDVEILKNFIHTTKLNNTERNHQNRRMMFVFQKLYKFELLSKFIVLFKNILYSIKYIKIKVI